MAAVDVDNENVLCGKPAVAKQKMLSEVEEMLNRYFPAIRSTINAS